MVAQVFSLLVFNGKPYALAWIAIVCFIEGVCIKFHLGRPHHVEQFMLLYPS